MNVVAKAALWGLYAYLSVCLCQTRSHLYYYRNWTKGYRILINMLSETALSRNCGEKKINSRATWWMMFLRSIIWRPALSLNQALWHRTVTFVTAAGALSCYCSHLEAAAIEMKWTLDFLGSAWVPLYMLAWSSLRNEHVSHVCSSIKVKMGLVLTPFCDYGREHGHEEQSW